MNADLLAYLNEDERAKYKRHSKPMTLPEPRYTGEARDWCVVCIEPYPCDVTGMLTALAEARQQLRLTNIDQCNTEAELAEARRDRHALLEHQNGLVARTHAAERERDEAVAQAQKANGAYEELLDLLLGVLCESHYEQLKAGARYAEGTCFQCLGVQLEERAMRLEQALRSISGYTGHLYDTDAHAMVRIADAALAEPTARETGDGE